MFEISDQIEHLYRAIEEMTDEDRGQLFGLLVRDYYLDVPNARAQLDRPWRDDRSGFGILQCKLLDLLADQEVVSNRAACRHLWPREAPPLEPAEVRQLEQEARRLPGQQAGLARKAKARLARHRQILAKAGKDAEGVWLVLENRLRQLRYSANRRLKVLILGWRIVPATNRLEGMRLSLVS
jgi:hypothetical protein